MIYSNTLGFFLNLRALKCIFMLLLSFFTLVCLTIDGVSSPYWLATHQGNTLSDAECIHFKQQLLMAWCRGTIAVSDVLIRGMMGIGSAAFHGCPRPLLIICSRSSAVVSKFIWCDHRHQKMAHCSPAASGNGAFWMGGEVNMLVLFSKWVNLWSTKHTYVFHTETKHMYKRH